MAYGGGSAREWQESEQTGGRSDYESQSWRDNYNGGRAAGDWSGNTNARLEREREAFGTTWSGSSTQPSALEFARAGGRNAYGIGMVYDHRTNTWSEPMVNQQPIAQAQQEHRPAPAPQVAPTAGPGVPGAQTRPAANTVVRGTPVAPGRPATPGKGSVAAAQTPATGVASPIARRTSTVLQQIGPGGPLRPKMEPTVQEIMLGGYKIQPKPNTSNAEEWEIRYAEPGEWVGGIVVMADDFGYNASKLLGFDSQRAGRDIRNAASAAPAAVSNGIIDFAAHLDTTRERVWAERNAGKIGGGF